MSNSPDELQKRLHVATEGQEVTFHVQPDSEEGFTARAIDHPIFIEADTLEQLGTEAFDATCCHFDASFDPAQIKLRLENDDTRPT